MSGFIEWEFPCPQCKQLTAVLDTGKITEELTCNNDECGYSHSFELTDNRKRYRIQRRYNKN